MRFLGPMVYGLLYLPSRIHRSLLAETHHFDDSKVLTPTVRSSLLETLCKPETDLHKNCGWATRVMSARDISAGMLKATGNYNLNAQAMDATIQLIRETYAQGINVTEIYIDTIGTPAVYQRKLEAIFPNAVITVAKRADSLFPCVSAASVCAKVTRDAALEAAYKAYTAGHSDEAQSSADGWGSGYPSDARCITWMKANVDPVFGWGNECRFSWQTAKDLLESKGLGFKADWPAPGNDDYSMRVTDFVTVASEAREEGLNELATWFGKPVPENML